MVELNGDELQALLAFRTSLRRYLAWSEQHAEAAGLTAARHQLLLAIAGHAGPDGPTVGELADILLLRHHSAVGLIDRAAAAGLVERHPDPQRHRAVRVQLTPAGRERLDALAAVHAEELERIGPHMAILGAALPQAEPRTDGPPPPPLPPHGGPHRPPRP